MFKKFKRLSNLPAGEKLVFAEAVLFLLLAKLVILLVPLRKAAPYFGVLNRETILALSNEKRASVGRLRKVLFAASANVPWRSVCMDQALAATIMLNRRHIPNMLFLGVKINQKSNKLDAHAWVSCDERIFIGGEESRTFNVVAFFSKW